MSRVSLNLVSIMARVRRLVRHGCDPCLQHRSALLGYVERPPAESPDKAALDHLERCSSCRAEIAAARLAGYAVERAWRDAAAAEPSAEGWSRLKARVERRPSGVGPAASPIVALALGMGITFALILPVALPRWSGPTIQESAPGSGAAAEDPAAGDPVIDRLVVPESVPLAQSEVVAPISADPVSAPRRPLTSIRAVATAAVSSTDPNRRTSYSDQDPRRVAQPPPTTESSPVSAPRRFTVV